MKYLFIDGNNLGCRAAFANKHLNVNFVDYSSDFNPDTMLDASNSFPTGAIHGFFKMILSAHRLYPDRYICVVWDGQSQFRIQESKEAVAKGIVPQVYKEHRKLLKQCDEIINFKRQRPVIMDALSMTNIPQVINPKEEADDVIASFVYKYHQDDILILTNDHDYYQLFRDNVSILDAGGSVLTKEWFKKAFGIEPIQWVDVGALSGDNGDGIHGLYQWGEGTSLKSVAKYGSCENVLKEIHNKFDYLRIDFPDLDKEQFELLKSFKTKDDKPRYPHIKHWMPYTGVALAYEQNKIKIPRSALMALIYESRVPLAKKLKAMRHKIPVPQLPANLHRNRQEDFNQLCRKYSLNEINDWSNVLCEINLF